MERIKRSEEPEGRIEQATDEDYSNLRKLSSSRVEFITTGSTTLNLAGSGLGRDGGWARGRVFNIVGDGSSGKTITALESAHWFLKNITNRPSAIFPPVEKPIVVFNNPEGVMDFPLADMYGEDFEKSIDWQHIAQPDAVGRDILRRMERQKQGEAILYLIDTWDALQPDKDDEKACEGDTKKAYDLDKQRYAWTFFRSMCKRMVDSNGGQKDFTLGIVSQTRQRIDATFGKKKYRTGGDALNFYTHQVCWLYEKGKLPKTVLGEKRVYALRVVGRFERNKVALPYREAEFQVLLNYGIDDVGSMLDWLYGPEAKGYPLDMKRRTAKQLEKYFEEGGKAFRERDHAIKYFEQEDNYSQLLGAVEDLWWKVEDGLKPDRRPKWLTTL
jgi:recombination protein RecA